MLWNPATGQLYSVGKDGKDDSGDVTLGITVSTSRDMTTALQCGLQPLICTSVGTLGGFQSEWVAGLRSEWVAALIGIRSYRPTP